MHKTIISGLLLATAFTATSAFAGPDCTEEPQDKWMSEMDMQKKIVNDYGFTINMFKVTSGNCYEIYGKAPKGDTTEKAQARAKVKAEETTNTEKAAEPAQERVKTEIYFHPITGEIVKQKIED